MAGGFQPAFKLDLPTGQRQRDVLRREFSVQPLKRVDAGDIQIGHRDQIEHDTFDGRPLAGDRTLQFAAEMAGVEEHQRTTKAQQEQTIDGRRFGKEQAVVQAGAAGDIDQLLACRARHATDEHQQGQRHGQHDRLDRAKGENAEHRDRSQDQGGALHLVVTPEDLQVEQRPGGK